VRDRALRGHQRVPPCFGPWDLLPVPSRRFPAWHLPGVPSSDAPAWHLPGVPSGDAPAWYPPVYRAQGRAQAWNPPGVPSGRCPSLAPPWCTVSGRAQPVFGSWHPFSVPLLEGAQSLPTVASDTVSEEGAACCKASGRHAGSLKSIGWEHLSALSSLSAQQLMCWRTERVRPSGRLTLSYSDSFTLEGQGRPWCLRGQLFHTSCALWGFHCAVAVHTVF